MPRGWKLVVVWAEAKVAPQRGFRIAFATNTSIDLLPMVLSGVGLVELPVWNLPRASVTKHSFFIFGYSFFSSCINAKLRELLNRARPQTIGLRVVELAN